MNLSEFSFEDGDRCSGKRTIGVKNSKGSIGTRARRSAIVCGSARMKWGRSASRYDCEVGDPWDAIEVAAAWYGW